LNDAPAVLAEPLLALERRLDPAHPTGGPGAVEVLGYGEVSAVLAHPALPGRALKRMSGFPSRDDALAYGAVVECYLGLLAAQGVPLVETALVPLEPAPGRHVVYLVQPRLDPRGLASQVLRHGSLDDGLRGDTATLYAKSVLDGVSSIVFASTMGIGVAFSAVTVLVYQGTITLLAKFVAPFLTAEVTGQMSLVGNVLIMAIGINLLRIKVIKVGNILPSIFLPLVYYFLLK
jgi:hypothetical protein